MSSQNGMADGSARRCELRRLGLGVLALALVGVCAAGCTTDGSPAMTVSGMRSPTVSFESIDGLPEPLFRKLVQTLTDESEARQVAVVTREGPSQYRVRGYAAAFVRAKKTTIAWVWDVYDADQQRALRISGEEQAASGGKRGWTAADDQTLRRIARDGMDQLSAFLANPASPPAATEPEPEPRDSGRTVASNDDFSPESSGIYRFFRGIAPTSANAAPIATSEASESASGEPIPLPQRRPRNAGLVSQAALAE